MFADAQKLASFELKSWNKKRHWSREAKRHKIMGAHRMAVSYFYKLLKENNIELEEALLNIRLERLGNKGVEGKREEEVREGEEWRAMDRESPFFYKLFGDIEEYYSEVIRLAG